MQPMNETSHPPLDTAAADSNRWIALVVLCAGFLMIILDQTIVNVALPTIQTDLHFSQSALAWVINAYLIAFGGLLLLVGRLGDLIGRRRIFLAGLTVFTTASLVCGLADSRALLIGARFVQGVGGAMTSAVILGMIVTMFPRAVGAGQGDRRLQLRGRGRRRDRPARRRRPDAGDQLALDLLRQRPDRNRDRRCSPPGCCRMTAASAWTRGADAPGAVLLVSSLMLAVYTIVEASNYSWGSAHTLGFGALAVTLLAGFIVRQATAASPLIPLRVFRSRTVTVANLMQMLMVAGIFGMFFLGALYLQRVLRYDAIEIGLAFLPVALGIAALSLRVAAQLMMRFGAKPTLIGGLALVAGGLLVFRSAPVKAAYVTDLLPAMLLLGVGAGLVFPALMTLAMSGATPEDSGLASGLVNTTAAGRWRARPGGARDAVDHPDELAGRARSVERDGAHRRLPPRVHDRRGACAGGDRDGRGLPTAERDGRGGRGHIDARSGRARGWDLIPRGSRLTGPQGGGS